MKSRDYKDLIVWQKAMSLVTEIYELTNNFPQSEQYGLTSQMRRSAVSIPSNIAEGSKRGTEKDFRHFLTTAFGSGAELETQVELSVRLSFVTKEYSIAVSRLLTEVMKMLYTMINKDPASKNLKLQTKN